MLHSIEYSVTFPSTGKTFAGKYDFETGLTTITGKNEAGKSLILEFARYLLFGSKALRGEAADYKTFKGNLTFSVKGTRYKVERKNGNATLYRGDEAVAVGTTAVNTKVPEIFGYGLDVFDAAHCVNQGQIEALGSMTPGERRKMVDSVIGLNVLDDLIKDAGEFSSNARAEALALDDALVKPEEPVKPEGYAPSAELQQETVALSRLKTERDQIEGWLKTEPSLPVEPTCEIEESADVLEAHQKRRGEVDTSLTVLRTKFTGMADPKYTVEQLDAAEAQIAAAEAYAAYQRALEKLPPKPVLTQEQIEEQRARLQARAKWEHDRYIWEQKKAAYEQHLVECPNCQHSFALGFDDPSAFDPGPEPEKPEWTKDQLDQEERRIKAWTNPPAEVPEAHFPDLTRSQIEAERRALAQVEEKAQLATNITVLEQALTELPDRSADLSKRRAYEKQLAVYAVQKAAYDDFQERKAAMQARLAELDGIDEKLAQAQAQYNEALVYEKLSKQYEQNLARYMEQAAKAEAARARAEQYAKAKRALQLLKSKVKSHLVPSLSTVASILLAQMTGGERKLIEVDEDFDIKVDGQKLNTLSGSGKSVANLAVRLGLGQVLTNRVFPVFMGDELDAAMDVDRAGFTAECLRNLTSKIPQVILVTHKRPEADHYIEVGSALELEEVA